MELFGQVSMLSGIMYGAVTILSGIEFGKANILSGIMFSQMTILSGITSSKVTIPIISGQAVTRMPMLTFMWVVLGHSERRDHHDVPAGEVPRGDTDGG
jgi:hypothetical protein